MVEAIFYVLRTAVAWRDLPACYGPWNSVYTRWRRWCALGLWQEILRILPRRRTIAWNSSPLQKIGLPRAIINHGQSDVAVDLRRTGILQCDIDAYWRPSV